DLAPTNIVVPASGLTGQGFNVSWTDQNNGTATAEGPWKDYVWISTSNTLDNSAMFLGQFTYNDALDAGQSVTRTQHFNLSGIAGQYYVIIRANADGAVNEGPGAADNTTASTATISVQTTPLPDLEVSVIVPPSDGVLSGTTVPVTYTVMNNGNAPTQAPLWYDAVFISQSPDLTLTGNDFTDGFNIQVQPLGVPIFAENASYLAPGESYSQTVNVPLPVSAAGPWYVYVVANRTFVHTPLDNFIDTGAVRESNSINDLTRSAAFNVSLAPAPDLAVTRVQAPSQAFSGQSMNLSWTVTNQGPGIAIGQPLHVGFAPTQAYAPATPAQSTWQESVYLSSSQSLDASAVLLGTFTHNGALGPGDSFTQSRTVTLPVGISGQYYLIVQDDASQQVFEAGATANNVLSAAATTNVNLTPPPDLQIASIVAPAAALASHTLAISYQVTNAGSTATPQNSWTDTVYLASGSTLDASTDLKLGDLTHRGTLSAGGSYTQTASFTLPNDLNGAFHVFVVTDSGNLVFELDKANNIVSAGNATTVSSKPADLVVTAASAPAAANPGQVIPVSWTVTNQGVGDTAVGDWTDKVYATTDAALGANRVLIAAFTRHHGLLQPGASYTETELVEIPYTLTGAYNLFVETDAPVTEAEDGQGAQTTGPGGAVYEAGAEANNVSSALAVLISAQLADLTVSQVQLLSPATLATGGSASVGWTVQNSGAAATSSTHWYDDVYLSPTPTFDPQTAVYLGSAFHNNPLPAGGQYTATASFTVPPDMAAGTSYLIVRADRPSRPPNTEPQYVNLVVESSESDNEGASAAITVDLGPTPDLTTAVTAPLSALSGQTIHIDWTVTNHGASTLAANGRWYDTVYLSLDQTFDANADVALGNTSHVTGLAADASYSAGGDFRLPAGLAGMYYVIVVADAGAAVYERGVSADRIGLSDQALDVALQPPLDLVAGTVTIPASAVPGQPVTVTYSVSNNSSNSYAGDWFDSLYLSPTNTWQLSNPLLGRVHHTGGVAANGSYSETLTAPLPGVSPGTYYVVLRSDIRNQVPETDETNNLSASAQTSLDVPEIIAGAPGTPVAGSLTQGGSAYYKVTVDAGQTLQFALSDAQANDVNGLYVSFGQAPSPSQSDFHGDQALGANQTITIPSTRAGTYYVQVISRTVYGYNSQSNPT
ncbi:MAG TPA: CARDB domain-containing protein, partial [Pirellulales bacterium]|nr:CARDB domain-containing protein [Pirellulales bacterium]